MHKLFSLCFTLFITTSTSFAIGRIFDQNGEITDSAQFHTELLYVANYQAAFHQVQFTPRTKSVLWLFALPKEQIPKLSDQSISAFFPGHSKEPILPTPIQDLQTVFHLFYYYMSDSVHQQLCFNTGSHILTNLSTHSSHLISQKFTHVASLSEMLSSSESNSQHLWALEMYDFPDSPLNCISPFIKATSQATVPMLVDALTSPQPKHHTLTLYSPRFLAPTSPLIVDGFSSKAEVLALGAAHYLCETKSPQANCLQFYRHFKLATLFPDLTEQFVSGLYENKILFTHPNSQPLSTTFTADLMSQLPYLQSLNQYYQQKGFSMLDLSWLQDGLLWPNFQSPTLPVFKPDPFRVFDSHTELIDDLQSTLDQLILQAPQYENTIVGYYQKQPVLITEVTDKILQTCKTGQRTETFEDWFIHVFTRSMPNIADAASDDDQSWGYHKHRDTWDHGFSKIETPTYQGQINDKFLEFLPDSILGDQLKALYLSHIPTPIQAPYPLEQTLQQISDSENFIETALLLTTPTQIGGGGYHPLDIHNNYHLPLRLRLLFASRHLTDELLFYGAKEDQYFDKAFIDALNRQPQVTLTYIDQWLNSDRPELHTNALHLIYYLSLTAPSNQALFEKAFRTSQILHTHLQQLDPDNDKQSELKIILTLRYGTLNTAFLTDFLSLHRITHDEIYHFEPEEVDPALQTFLRKYCKAPTNQLLTPYINDHNSTPYFKQFYIHRRNLSTYLAMASKLRLPAARTYLKTQLRNNTPNTSTLSGRSSLTSDETPILYPYIYDDSVLSYAPFFLDDPEIADFFLKDQFIPYLLTLRQVTAPVVKAWCDTQFIKTGQPKYQLWAQLCQTTPVMSADEHLAIYQKIVELIHNPSITTQQIRDALFDHPLIAIDSAFWEVILENRQNGHPLAAEPAYFKKIETNLTWFKINHLIGLYFLDHFSPNKNTPTTRSTPSTH